MKMKSKYKIETIKNLVIGVLVGTVIALWLTTVRFYIDKESAEKNMQPPAIKLEVPKGYNKARNMPVFPDPPLTEKEFLSLASMFPEAFTDEELIQLLIK